MKNEKSEIQQIFKEIVEDLLFPLFPGVRFGEPVWVAPPKAIKTKLVALENPARLNLSYKNDKTIRCQIERNQAFSTREQEVVENFLNNIDRVFNDWRTPYARDTSSSFMSKIVAQSVSSKNEDFLLKILSVMTDWAQQTYEGQRISFSLGIKASPSCGHVKFEELFDSDFFKVISNGHDSIVVFDECQMLVGHERVDCPKEYGVMFSPIRFVNFAGWTNDNDNIAVVLNRNGEILIFEKGQISFAKRRGSWRYFAHESVVKKFTDKALGRKTPEALRKELYLTALDVSFARTGGCIGVTTASNKNTLLNDEVISKEDLLLEESRGVKARAIDAIVNGEKFQNLDRLLRLELVSIDGATVLDYEGNILAAGAILSIDGGSSGGGRQAATSAIAKYGIGIKISNDGYIKVLNRDKEEIVRLS